MTFSRGDVVVLIDKTGTWPPEDVGEAFVVERGPDADGNYWVIPLLEDNTWPKELYVRARKLRLATFPTPEAIEKYLNT